MKSRLLPLNPIKISNRLVPKTPTQCQHSSPTKTNKTSEPTLTQPKNNTTGIETSSFKAEPIATGSQLHSKPEIKVVIHRNSKTINHDPLLSEPNRTAGSNGSEKGEESGLPPREPPKREEPSLASSRGVAQETSTEYYREIDHRINNGIKKLQEMDKRLAVYDSHHKTCSINGK
jgi:hypothetical protein